MGNCNSNDKPAKSASITSATTTTTTESSSSDNTMSPFERLTDIFFPQQTKATKVSQITLFQQPADKTIQDTTSAPSSAAGMSNLVALRAGCFGATEEEIIEAFCAKFPGSIRTTTGGYVGRTRQDRDTLTQIGVLLVELHDPEEHLEELIRAFFQAHCGWRSPVESVGKTSRLHDFSTCIFFSGEQQLGTILRTRADFVDAGNNFMPYLSPLSQFTAEDSSEFSR